MNTTKMLGPEDSRATCPPVLRGLRVAIVHEWLTSYAGSERVLEQLLRMFPDADLYTLVDTIKGEERAFLGGREVRTSFVQRFGVLRRHYRHLLPLMFFAVEQFDLSSYDLVLSSSHAVAKGALTGPEQVHVCYCHSPMRYAWDLQHEYLRESGLERGLKGLLARTLLHYARVWDTRTSNGVDRFVANSRYIRRRIQKAYGRDADVVYPPVEVDAFPLSTAPREEFYLAASRFVPYKRMGLLIEAFRQMPSRELVLIGDGPEFARCYDNAPGNVRLLGRQPAEVLTEYLQRARAFLFAAREDFGIVPVESMAAGTPVIAFGRGGVRETVQEGVTGLFFDEQTPAAVIDAVNRFESMARSFDPARLRARACEFAPAAFQARMYAAIESAWMAFHEGD